MPCKYDWVSAIHETEYTTTDSATTERTHSGSPGPTLGNPALDYIHDY